MTEPQRIPAWSRHTKIKVVGAGGSGQVYLVAPFGAEASPSNYCVAKRVFVDDNAEQAQCAAIETEVLQALPHHANVVSYREHYFDDEGYFNVILEYCPEGDLDKALVDRAGAQQPLSLREVAFLTFQLLCGVRHLHRHHVVHRDLKPGNLFLVSKLPGSSSPSLMTTTRPPKVNVADFGAYCVKIADFGISRIMQTGGVATTVVGTPFYIAPEICESQPYASSADMWAVGCIIYELCTLNKLFSGSNMLAVVRAIAVGHVPSLPPAFAALEPLVRALVVRDAPLRLTADGCIKTFFAPRPSRTVEPSPASGNSSDTTKKNNDRLGRYMEEL